MPLAAAPLVFSQLILAGGTVHSLGRNLNHYLSVPLQIYSICPAYVGRCQIFFCVAELPIGILHFTVSELASPRLSLLLPLIQQRARCTLLITIYPCELQNCFSKSREYRADKTMHYDSFNLNLDNKYRHSYL